MGGTSVINPMIFYWMDIIKNFDVAINYIGIFLTIVLVSRILVYFMGVSNISSSIGFSTEKYIKRYQEVGNMCIELSTKWLKPNIILTLICLLITVLIPSKDTMMTMLVADMITYENIELTKESAIAIIDYIVEQVNMITR